MSDSREETAAHSDHIIIAQHSHPWTEIGHATCCEGEPQPKYTVIRAFSNRCSLNQVKGLLENGTFLHRAMLVEVLKTLQDFCKSTGIWKHNKTLAKAVSSSEDNAGLLQELHRQLEAQRDSEEGGTWKH
eukprot:411300-Pelagomonas_calceolata.AAC.6